MRNRWILSLLLGAVASHAVDAQHVEARYDSLRWVGAEFGYSHFDDSTDPWRTASLSAGIRGHQGSLIGRVNHARRFGVDGLQFEGDAWPRFTHDTYAYLNLGYSNASIFPEWRVGAEVFKNLPHAWEASLGFRRLDFAGARATLFTGTVGKYFGNYWYSIRPYLTDRSNGMSAAATLYGRRYFADADHYLGGWIGLGSTPSDRITANELARSTSFTFGAQGIRGVGRAILFNWSLGYEHEKFGAAGARNRLEGIAGVRLVY